MRRKFANMQIDIPESGDATITLSVPIQALRALYAENVERSGQIQACYVEFIRNIIARARDGMAVSARTLSLADHEVTEELRPTLPGVHCAITIPVQSNPAKAAPVNPA